MYIQRVHKRSGIQGNSREFMAITVIIKASMIEYVYIAQKRKRKN